MSSIVPPARRCQRSYRQFGRCTAMAFAVAVVSLGITPSRAENWPSFRGPLGTGVSEENGLSLSWGGEKNVARRTPLPDRGSATPVIWGDCVFVAQAIEIEAHRTLMCFDRSTGKLLWQSGITVPAKEPT